MTGRGMAIYIFDIKVNVPFLFIQVTNVVKQTVNQSIELEHIHFCFILVFLSFSRLKSRTSMET